MTEIKQVPWFPAASRLVDALFPQEAWALSAHFAAERGQGELYVLGSADGPASAAVRLVDTLTLAGRPDPAWSDWLGPVADDLEPGYLVCLPDWSGLVRDAVASARQIRFAIYHWPMSRPAPVPGDDGRPAGGGTIRRLAPADRAALQTLGEPWMWKHFGSAQGFLDESIVFGAFEGDALRSVSGAFGWSSRFEDIAVATHPAHRRRGWGSRCASAMIADSLTRGRQPVWKAQADNVPSRRTAERIGFELHHVMTIFRIG